MKAGLSSAGAKHQQMSFVLDISIKNLHRTAVAEARGSNFQVFFLNLEASWKCVLQEFVSLFVFIIQCNVFAICFTLATVLVCLPACS